MAIVNANDFPELTPAEIEAELERARKMPQVYDDDCPELSPLMLKQLKVAARNRNRIIKAAKENLI